MPSSGLPQQTDVTVTIDIGNEIEEVTKSNNTYEARVYVVEEQDFYSYDTFLRLEPLWGSYWKDGSAAYTFSVSGKDMPVLEQILLSGYRPEQLATTKLQSGLDKISNYMLRINKNSKLYALHDFSTIDRTTTSSYESANSTGIRWWADPAFLRRMHYERINSLTIIWWQLWMNGA